MAMFSQAAWEAASRKLAEDKELARASDAYYDGPLQFVRAEVMLLRGFATMPRIWRTASS